MSVGGPHARVDDDVHAVALLDAYRQRVEAANPEWRNCRFTGPLLSLLVKVRLVRLPLWCLRAAGSPASALLLGQLLYYLEKRRVSDRYGYNPRWESRARRPDRRRGLPRPWIALTATTFARQTGLTQDQVEYGLVKLERLGLIGRAKKVFRGGGELAWLRCSHVWLGPACRGRLAMIRRAPSAARLSVPVFLWAMRACRGDVNAAAVLGYLWFRTHPGRANRKFMFGPPRPEQPVRKRPLQVSRRALAAWTGLSFDQVKRALSTLRRHDLVETGQRLVGGRNANVIDVNYDRCAGYVLLTAGFAPSQGGRRERD